MTTRAPDTIVRPGEWTHRAACKGDDTDGVFFDDRSPADAKARCAGCPVREQCLADAMEWESVRGNARFGVFGGLTADQRKAKAEKEAAATPAAPAPAPVVNPPRPLAECGTESAYNRHVRRKEPVDEACAQARRDADRRRSGTTRALV